MYKRLTVLIGQLQSLDLQQQLYTRYLIIEKVCYKKHVPVFDE